MHLKVVIFILMGFSASLFGQGKFSVSGYVKDANTGETLTGASVYVKTESNLGASTNTYGFLPCDWLQVITRLFSPI